MCQTTLSAEDCERLKDPNMKNSTKLESCEGAIRILHGQASKPNFKSPQNKSGRHANNRDQRSPDHNIRRPKMRTKPLREQNCIVEDMEYQSSSPVPIPARTGNRTPPRTAGGSPFAGAKFHDPPSPQSLPKPPTHWIEDDSPSWGMFSSSSPVLHDQIAAQLKTLLKVQN